LKSEYRVVIHEEVKPVAVMMSQVTKNIIHHRGIIRFEINTFLATRIANLKSGPLWFERF
jgi:hypothetical protein